LYILIVSDVVVLVFQQYHDNIREVENVFCKSSF